LQIQKRETHVNSFRRIAILGMGALAAFAIAPRAADAQAANVTIDVNGQPLTFDQPPVERAGRIYVPLRGVFERLGASVVYANGQINATSGSHQIALQIGSPSATVDGAQQTLDSPPFLLGGRTLVPLRFISQALGASVNFDQGTQTVYVVQQQTAAAPPPRHGPLPGPAPIAVCLIRLLPVPDTTVNARRPEIAATFAEPVDPNSITVSIDGRDVTSQTYVSARSFVYDPTFDLPPASHEVVVTGRTPDHERFREHWSFASATGEGNYINGLEPPNGTPARLGFTVSGFTKPGSTVRVVATTSETLANFEVAQGSTSADTVADGRGYFAAPVTLETRAENIVDVRIVATAPDGTTAVKTLRLLR
jgi:hypothetical protein